MTNYVAGTGCASRAHTDDLRAYDGLPRPIRDKLKVSRVNFCSACIARIARRDPAATLEWLDFERTHRQAWVRRGDRLLQIQVREPELKP